jgi:hypothetical protein
MANSSRKMKTAITHDELVAFLGDALPETRMIEIERAIREDEGLRSRLATLLEQYDSGSDGLGEIWKRYRLSCPSRETLGSFLFNVLSPEQSRFIELHLTVTQCPFCQSNLDDLKRSQEAADQHSSPRQQRFFQSSVGRLPKK